MFSEFGINKISDNNGLSVGENKQLFKTLIIDEVIELTLKGLGCLAKRRN